MPPRLHTPVIALALSGLLVVALSGCGPADDFIASDARSAPTSTPAGTPDELSGTPEPTDTNGIPATRTSQPAPPPSSPTSPTSPEPTPPTQRPGPTLLALGDEGPQVRDLQARLAQIDWFLADVTGYYGEVTEHAVTGFQTKRGFPATGEVDRRTLNRLHQMTTKPTKAALFNIGGDNTPGAVDPRCKTGRVLCVDKTSRTLRWMIDGKVFKTVDARFGGASTPTREGAFKVHMKSRDHVSSIFNTPMPYAMFFSRGQAVHYSPDFAAVGYSGASHGCVNVRDQNAVAWLFDEVQVGDRVVVYWS